jgi:flavin reductase (DIM6/NTAB) family NADH-FMN oxidoreductase RutF
MKYAKAVEFLGIRSSAEFKDKLAASGLTHELGSVLKVPIIRKAVAVLECDLVGVHKTGDHDFLIGEIKAARASSDFSDYWRFKDYNPILYIGSENGFEVQTMK